MEYYRRSDPLVEFEGIWIRFSDISAIHPKLVGTEEWEHTLVLLRNGHEIEVHMSINDFFSIARKVGQQGAAHE